MIPYGRQDVTQSDIDSVVAVLRSDFLTQGPITPQFERKMAEHVSARNAVATSNATSALHVACLALGLGAGDWLWTTPTTFVASANCALYCGARVDFVDIDPTTYNMSISALKEKLERAKHLNKLPKVLVAVHLCGLPCDMRAIHALSQEYGFSIIEDASHAVGAKYLGEFVGGCRYSDVTIFSFHPVKIITTGEGGMALTNDDGIARSMELLRSHGVTRDPAQMTHEPDGPWYYQQVALGFNYRLTDIQAALGISQLERLTGYLNRRHEIAQRYGEALAHLPCSLPRQDPNSYSAFHLYVVRLSLAPMEHRQVFDILRDKGILVNLHYIPVHTQPYYQKLGFKEGDFPESEKYYREAISLPIFPTFSEAQQDFVVSALSEALGH